MPRQLPLLACLVVAGSAAWSYEDGAPPGHTGGFGEPECSFCHSDRETNPPDGRLAIEGLPERYLPGRRYALAVLLEHPALQSGGYQLAFRSEEGEPAGQLAAASSGSEVVAGAEQVYLQHTASGRKAVEEGRIRWEFSWTAPGDDGATAPGPVHIHVAGNAANDDASALGDRVFTLERVLQKKQE